MFQVILKQVWRDSRWMLLFLAACTVVVTEGAVRLVVPGAGSLSPMTILVEAQFWGLAMPVLAFFAALLLSIITWWPDRRGWWVYALTLPVARERYVALRAAAGGVLLAGLALAFWLAALAAAGRAVLPEGLQTYPNALALRFALALLACHALWTLCSLAGRTVARVVGIAIVVVVLLELLNV
ncbi:MAG: hypothetical protein ACHQXA_10205, partial [Gemmatimonadales bacterium]